MAITKYRIEFVDGSEKIVEVPAGLKIRARRDAGPEGTLQDRFERQCWYGAQNAGLTPKKEPGDIEAMLAFFDCVAIFDLAEIEDGEDPGESGATPAE